MGAEILANIGADFSAMEAARKRDEQAWRQWASNNGNSIASLTARINAETAKMQTAEAAQLSALRDKQRAYRVTLGIDAATMATQMPLQSWGSPTGEKSPAVGLRGLHANAEKVAVLLSGGLGAGFAVMALEKLSTGFAEARQRTAEFRKELEEVRHSQDFYGREGLGGIAGLQQQRAAKMREMDTAHAANNADVFSRFYNPTAWWKYEPQSDADWKKNRMGQAYDSQIEKMAEVQASAEEHKLSVIRAQAEGRALDAKWLETEYEFTRKISEAEKLGYRGEGLVSALSGQREALRDMNQRERRSQGLEQQADYWREGVLRDTSITSESERQLALLQAQLSAQQAITAAAQTGLEIQRSKTKEAELGLQISQAQESKELKRIGHEAAMQAAGLRSDGITGQVARLNIENVALQKQRDATKDAEKRRDIELQIAQNEQQQAAVGKQLQQQTRDLDTDFQRQMILNNRSNQFRKFTAMDFSTTRSIEDYQNETDPLKKLERRNKLAGDVGSLQDMRWSLISKPTIADDMTKIGGGGFSYAGPNNSDTLKSIDDNIKRLLEAMASHTTAPNAMSVAVMSN